MSIQKLNVQLEELGLLIDNRETVVKNLKEQRTDKFSRIIHKYFDSVLYSEDTIAVNRTYVYFKRPQEGYNYSKELMSLNFEEKSWRDETVNNIRTSFYSTNDDSKFELHRMLLIGKVANILIDSKQDIIYDWNEVMSEFKEQLKVAHEDLYKVKKQYGEVEDEIDALEKQQALDELENGYEFEFFDNDNTTGVRIDTTFNEEVRNITKIKMLSKTPSGKSATLEIEKAHYNGDRVTNTYKNIRMNNVMNFVDYYADKRISVS